MVLKCQPAPLRFGSMFEDDRCESGHALAGTYDAARGGPFCAPAADPVGVPTGGLLGATRDEDVAPADMLGALLVDNTCSSGHALAGTFDPER